LQNSSNNGFERCFQLRKTIAQQQTQIDALSAIVELAFVNGQARRFGKRLGESILGKEILQVIIHTFGKRPEARLMADQRLAGTKPVAVCGSAGVPGRSTRR